MKPSMIIAKIIRRIRNLLLWLNSSSSANKIRKSIDSIRDADILVLGSAPNPILPESAKDMLLVCCNGSAANLKQLGMQSPVMTVVDFELIDPEIAYTKKVRSDIVKERILADLQLGTLVGTQSNPAIGGAPEILGAHYDRFISIDKFSRRKILDIVTGTEKLERDVQLTLCSTGAFAIALSLFLGARSVSISGFTHLMSEGGSSQMHFYDEASIKLSGKLDTRNHSMADSALIVLSVLNGHTILTREHDLLPLVQNWGNDGL